MSKGKIHTKVAVVYLKDGIIRLDYKNGAIIDISEAKDINKAVEFLEKEQKKTPMLVDGRNVRSVSSEARDYFSSDECNLYISKVALWTASPLSKFLGNLILKFKKGATPFKIFSNPDKAIIWLKK